MLGCWFVLLGGVNEEYGLREMYIVDHPGFFDEERLPAYGTNCSHYVARGKWLQTSCK